MIFWTQTKCQKRLQAPKPIFLVWNLKNLETRFHIWRIEKYPKFAHGISVQNGSDAFPNELTRFRFEATPIWEKSETL